RAGWARDGDERATFDIDADTAERVDGVGAEVVVLRESVGHHDRAHGQSLRRGDEPLEPGRLPPAAPTITSWPSRRSPESTSVDEPSLMPSVIATAFGVPPPSITNARPRVPPPLPTAPSLAPWLRPAFMADAGAAVRTASAPAGSPRRSGPRPRRARRRHRPRAHGSSCTPGSSPPG